MKIKKKYFNVEKHGFYGVYFQNPKTVNKAIILMLGDSVDDRMAVCGAKWAMRSGCNVLTMSPAKKDYGHHSYPLERFEKAIRYLKHFKNEKIGIVGASTTGMLALVTASYFPEITLTIAISPSDFVMEGFYRDGLDGARERPGDYESSVSYRGKQLPFLPYAYRHPKYWEMIKKETKDSGNIIASRKLFDESERLHPIKEDEKIKVENINGKVIFVGAEDDVLWNTCKYIDRMVKRLETLPHNCEYQALTYKYGTHFMFPQSMLEMMMKIFADFMVEFSFKSARKHPLECKSSRVDIDKKLKKAIIKW